MTATQISGTSRRSYEAVLKYYDKKRDTAVLKIEGNGFESFGLLTRIVRVGERVYAIGNPRGLEQSISEGIVSGLREEDGTLWIQHSAPISPGSSGGALISSRGELLGINSWFVRESQGLNFAVPASTLASAYSGARALQSFLRFPGSPPVSKAPSPARPPKDVSRPAPAPPSAMSGPLSGQNPPNPAEQLVRLNVTVSDKTGHRVTNLPQSAFTVLENGAPQQIKIFKLEDVPVSMGLIIDNSDNMRERRLAVESSARSLVRDLNPQDEVFVVNSNDEAYMDVDFTGDIRKLEDGISRFYSRGGSAMRDAIYKSMGHLKKRAKHDKKVIVVVTDGYDNASEVTLEAVARQAKQDDVRVYAIGLLSEKEPKKEAAKAKRALNLLAEGTGGEVFYPRDLTEIERIAHEMARDIRSQYTIAYTPANQKLDGSFRTISVVVKGPGSPAARTRQGYYATKDGP